MKRIQWLNSLAEWNKTTEFKIRRKAQLLRFQKAEKHLNSAYCELTAIHRNNGGRVPQQLYNVRDDIHLTLREIQIYKHHLGLITDEELPGTLKAVRHDTIAA